MLPFVGKNKEEGHPIKYINLFKVWFFEEKKINFLKKFIFSIFIKIEKKTFEKN